MMMIVMIKMIIKMIMVAIIMVTKRLVVMNLAAK